MSSILTNNSAMVALESLRMINRNLETVQAEISTGKKIASAKDNASIWAISTVMTTDVESFRTIRNSLDLASSTVGVARAAAEQVTDLLKDMKSLIIAAQEPSGRVKIQADISELRQQIGGIVKAAQFNGQNLLKGNDSISVLSSLDRASDQSVSRANIEINRQDLQIGTFGTTPITGTNPGFALAGTASITAAGTSTVTLTAGAVTEGMSFRVDLGGEANRVEYIAFAGDTMADVVNNLKAGIESRGIAGISVTAAPGTNPLLNDSILTITNNSSAPVSLTAASFTGGVPGGLDALRGIDVTQNDTTAGAALTAIEGLLSVAIDAAAALGSSQKRIENQGDFMTTLIDSITSGVGALTDADMEAASARLQALQVQQQLGTQALSIANQSAQSLLSLFR